MSLGYSYYYYYQFILINSGALEWTGGWSRGPQSRGVGRGMVWVLAAWGPKS